MLKSGGIDRHRLSWLLTSVGVLTVLLFVVGVITGSAQARKLRSVQPVESRFGETAYYNMQEEISVENLTGNGTLVDFAQNVQKLHLPFAPRKPVIESATPEGPAGTGSPGEELEGGKHSSSLYVRNGNRSFAGNMSDAETSLPQEPRRHWVQQLSPDAPYVSSPEKTEALLTANSSVLSSAPKGDVNETGSALSSSSSEQLVNRGEAPRQLRSLQELPTDLRVGVPYPARRLTPAAFDTGVDGSRETRLFYFSRELNRIADEYAKGKVGKEWSSPGMSSLDAKQEVFGEDRTSVLNRDSKEVGVAKTARGGATSDWASLSDAEPLGERDFSSDTADNWNIVVGRKTILAEGGDIYCSVGPAYTGPLPRSLCSYYLIQNSVQYRSSNKTLRVASTGSWRTLVNGGNGTEGVAGSPGPRVLLVMAAPEVKSVLADFPLPVQFVERARSLLEEAKLAGLALDVSPATDYDFGSYSMLLKVTRENLPQYHIVGIIDFVAASKLKQANLAELVRSADKVFLHNDPRHVHISATSVPNPFTSPNHGAYSVENAVRLAEDLRMSSLGVNNVCPTLSLAVFKFETSDRGADTFPPALGTLATEVDVAFPYSKLCKMYRGHHTHYDEETLSTYLHSRNSWLGFDDDASMETKIDKLIQLHHVGCFLVENIDLDDPTDVCKTGDFRRLRLIKQALERGERL